jgi:hypothetical protein
MGASEHSGWVDSRFHSTQTLERRPIMESIAPAARAFVVIGVMDAGPPGEEGLLNQLYMGVDLRSRGRIWSDSNCKHQKLGIQVTDGAGIHRALGKGAAEVSKLHRQERRSRSVTGAGDERVDRR